MTDETTWPKKIATIGVVGLDMIGRSISLKLARDGHQAGLGQVAAFDHDEVKRSGLEGKDVLVCASLAHLVDKVDLVLLCLPGAGEVAKIARAHEGLLDCVRQGQIIVDHGWSSLDLTRQLATAFASKGAGFIDAPIGKSGKVDGAIDAGRLTFSIGGEEAAIEAALPALRCFARDMTRVGPAGTAQVIRHMGDLVAFQTFSALAEAFVTARAFGIDGRNLFDALAKNNRNDSGGGQHHLAAFLAVDDALQEDRTSIADAGRRLEDAISLAHSKKITLAGADSTSALFEKAIEMGLGDDGLNGLFRVMAPETRAKGGAKDTTSGHAHHESKDAGTKMSGRARQARG